jgi:hypothetical protein
MPKKKKNEAIDTKCCLGFLATILFKTRYITKETKIAHAFTFSIGAVVFFWVILVLKLFSSIGSLVAEFPIASNLLSKDKIKRQRTKLKSMKKLDDHFATDSKH